jgi:cell wall-associated NlpC family hydrolase
MLLFDIYELIGTPFVNGGRSVKKGFDCWGLVLEIYRRAGIKLQDYKISSDECELISKEIELETASGKWQRHNHEDAPPLSIVVMRFNRPDCWNHTGVYLGGGKFIHTREKIGVTVERIDSPMWKNRIEGFYTQGVEKP